MTEPKAEPEKSGEREIEVLLVEDDPIDRRAFERHVEEQGLPYVLTAARSIAEGRERLAERSFDIVVTDYYLGDGHGFELLEQAVDTPVVVVTGGGDEQLAARALRAGAYDYLVKDLERSYLELVSVTVDNALRRSASERQARQLEQALRSINDAIFVVDLQGRFTFVNQSFTETYGYRGEEVLGEPCVRLWNGPPAAGEIGPPRPEELPPEGRKGECRHRHRDGHELAVLLSVTAVRDTRGRPTAGVGAARDISERKHWERAIREREERYALTAAGANDGLWDWDLTSGEVYYSPRWKAILEESEEVVGTAIEAWLERVHPEDLELLRAQMDAHLSGRTPHFENEHRMRSSSGEYRWVQTRGLAVLDEKGRATRMAGSMRDVTDRRRAEMQLAHAALHDDLTELPNRTLFMDRLDSALKRNRRRDDFGFAVIFLDLDRFKVVNDSLGHLAGDQLLGAIAQRLKSCVRLGDTVARLGGDEFAVLLEELDGPDSAEHVADRIQRDLQQPFEIDGHEIYSSASLGIALGSPRYERPEEVLRDADTAMYRAKAQARTGRVLFEPEMHADAVAQLRIQSELRRAVEGGELRLYYQPIVALAGDALVGFEALLRWQHPERGLLLPGDFLPAAREAGVAVRAGRWVLDEACRQLGAWRREIEAAGGLWMSVNLGEEQLVAADLVSRVEAALADAGLEAASLRLELTEQALLPHLETTAQTLTRLRQLGVELHIDDFGTGYSSLGQLHRFPIDALKVDRSFIGRMRAGGDEVEIVRTIVALAHNLGLEVLAEGVETAAQLDRLRQLGCELAQGHYFSRPLEPSQAAEMITSGQIRFQATDPGSAGAGSGPAP